MKGVVKMNANQSFLTEIIVRLIEIQKCTADFDTKIEVEELIEFIEQAVD
jgi:hypothetical protein